MHGENKEWHAHSELYMHDLDRMYGCHGEGCRLPVFVVQLVKVLIQEPTVVHPVKYVCGVILWIFSQFILLQNVLKEVF